ncbi:conserved hypothetical protein [Ricinus communis]|uniref:Uncharacterized protein n=1 Tax=Ricinus communis TaxID=3988 RepID=B9SS51_RICCO|nr:conserved hypothetical protein [Ricinus communis]
MQSSRKLINFFRQENISLFTHHHPKASVSGHRSKPLATDHDHHRHAKTRHHHIRKGFVAMYVGKELKRYEVPVDYLNFLKVQELLKLSQEGEEFDYIIDGAIKLTCTTKNFDQVLLECAKAKESKYHTYNLLKCRKVGLIRQKKPRQGHVSMYVGRKQKKYEVPVEYLNFPTFKRGVKLPEDGEYDCTIDGPILLPQCTTEEFDKLLSECAKGSHSSTIA